MVCDDARLAGASGRPLRATAWAARTGDALRTFGHPTFVRAARRGTGDADPGRDTRLSPTPARAQDTATGTCRMFVCIDMDHPGVRV